MEKSGRITYPLFLVPLEAGYVSVVDSQRDLDDAAAGSGQPEDSAGGEDETAHTYYLAVFSQSKLAEDFMAACGIAGEPRPIQNGREFAWLVQSLRAPIRHLAFDPQAGTKHVSAAWKVSVEELLRDHIIVDYSPWNYPVFCIEQTGGFASIQGRSSNGETLVAVGLFTTEEKAQKYLGDINESGRVRALANLHETRRFLEAVSPSAAAVALNITVENGEQSAKYCFSIDTVLEKYLIEQ